MDKPLSDLEKSGSIKLKRSIEDAGSIVISGDFCPLISNDNELVIESLISQFDDSIRREIIKSELAITNLECPLTDSKEPIAKTGPSLRAAKSHSRLIDELGFDLVSLANNHILDYGSKGLMETIESCSMNSLDVVGAGKNINEARSPHYTKVNKSRIAILSGSEREFSIASDRSPGACPLDILIDEKRIQDAKTKADIVIYLYHGGNLYYEYPSPWMRNYCKNLVDLGADTVICHHSHAMSGIEIYKDSPICYGLGNFFFPWASKRPDSWYYGYLITLKIGNKSISGLEILPYHQCMDGSTNVKILSPKKKRTTMKRIKEISQHLLDDDLFNQEWGKYCNSRKASYISNILQLSKLERILYAKSGFLFNRRKKLNSLSKLLNIIRCESHRCTLLEVLKNEIHKEL